MGGAALWAVVALCGLAATTVTAQSKREHEAGGDDDSDSAPFMVVMEHEDGRRCSGSLVSLRTALTSAWCVYGDGRSGRDARVVWAVAPTTSGEPRRAARVALPHDAVAAHLRPGWLGAQLDIAVIELEAPFGRGARSRPILMASGPKDCALGTECHVVRARGNPPRLLIVDAVKETGDACDAAAPGWPSLRESALCLSGPTLCSMDRGAGVVCSGKLCGVLSRSMRSGTWHNSSQTAAEARDATCGDVHVALNVAHWRRFLHCAHVLRACGREEGECAQQCIEQRLIAAPASNTVHSLTAWPDRAVTSGGITNKNAPNGDVPSGDAPGGDAPGGDAPGGDASSGDAPGGDAPSGDAPSGDAANGDAPNSEAASGDTPSGDADAPSGDTLRGDAPNDDAPSGDMPSGAVPSDDGPSRDMPYNTVPSEDMAGGDLPSNANSLPTLTQPKMMTASRGTLTPTRTTLWQFAKAHAMLTPVMVGGESASGRQAVSSPVRSIFEFEPNRADFRAGEYGDNAADYMERDEGAPGGHAAGARLAADRAALAHERGGRTRFPAAARASPPRRRTLRPQAGAGRRLAAAASAAPAALCPHTLVRLLFLLRVHYLL